MSTRVTIPEGKVAVMLDQELAMDLSTLLITIGRNPGRRVQVTQPMSEVAKECWFDLAVGLSELANSRGFQFVSTKGEQGS